MDAGSIERGIVIWVDGEGKLNWKHDGLTPLEIQGVLAMVAHNEQHESERQDKETVTKAAGLLDSIRKMRSSNGG